MILFLLTTLAISGISCEDPIIQISNGKIRGKVMTTFLNNTYYAFEGIPYAKPPVGELRFQSPQHPDDWEGVLDATNPRSDCIQQTPDLSENESEDCLYLHVYTPQLPEEDQNISLPIIYVIHGGAFVFGTAGPQDIGPKNFIDYGVILVSVSYRLGFFGFLSTGDLTCPGNNGFKDQQFGLRWVQENIKSFGGDPKKVTLFGESAGGASVGYQLLGSNAQGLFRGAIQDSGTSLGDWTLQQDPLGTAFQIANYINLAMNESNTTVQELYEFFKNVEVIDVKKACSDVFGIGMIGGYYNTLKGFGFIGTIEPDHEGAFLTELPYQLLATGNYNVVPNLIGVMSEECLFLINDTYFIDRMKYYDEHLEQLVLPNMHITDKNLLNLIGKEIREFYVKKELLQNNHGPSITYFSDTTFVRPSVKQAKLESQYSDVYFYEFSYSGSLGGGDYDGEVPGAERVTHYEEMFYLFDDARNLDPYTFPDDDVITMKRLLTMWTNFVKYLNPTPEPLELLQNLTWPKVTPHQQMPYLSINKTLEVRYNYKQAMIDKYDYLYDHYAIPPLDTY